MKTSVLPLAGRHMYTLVLLFSFLQTETEKGIQSDKTQEIAYLNVRSRGLRINILLC